MHFGNPRTELAETVSTFLEVRVVDEVAKNKRRIGATSTGAPITSVEVCTRHPSIYSTKENGTVAYIDNTLTYSTDDIDPNVLTVMVNAVGYADRGSLFADGFESGNTNSWSEVH